MTISQISVLLYRKINNKLFFRVHFKALLFLNLKVKSLPEFMPEAI